MHVSEFLRVSRTVADLDATQRFHADGLGFERGVPFALDDPGWQMLLGLDASVAPRAVRMRLGTQEVEFVAFDPPGRSYPETRAANDSWFQHVAIVIDDIQAAYSRLQAVSATTISRGGPQLLPISTQSVSAYKFRDPDGQPLELLHLPPGVGDARWHLDAAADPRGWDHSAISVRDASRSIAFYTELLGFSVSYTSLNTGIEQERLDGLSGVVVDVVGLAPASAPTPHLELLAYREPSGRMATDAVLANDIASTRQVYRVDDLDGLVERLTSASTTFVSPGTVTLGNGQRAAAIRDPDGHMIVLQG